MNKSKRDIAQFSIICNWETLAALLRSRFSRLTEYDLAFEVGKENELIDRMCRRLNKTRDAIIGLLIKTSAKLS